MSDPLLEFVRRLPAALRDTFRRGDRGAFDRTLKASELFSPGTASAVDRLADQEQFDPAGRSAYETLDALARRRLIDDADA